MRAVLLAILLAGCASWDLNDADAPPGISMSVDRIDNNGDRWVGATLTSVRGPIDDWSDLDVRGCSAPASGAIEVPHALTGCAWNFSIRYVPTGEVLYSI